MAVESLSFDRHLRHAFAPLSGRLERGIRSLDGVIEMLRLRIEAEAQFASSLERIILNDGLLCNLDIAESLRRDGLDALIADMNNEYTQRIEFLNSLNEDVYQPLVSQREIYAEKNRLFANNTKQNIKSLRQQQNQFYKIKIKYEKVCKDASNARTALLNAKLDNKISSASILKLGSKVNNTLKTQQIWKEKYDQQQLLWNKQQIKFDDEMTNILQSMQSNEYNRMKTNKDSLNKWAVFITNLCANRNYDVKNLAESMSLINIDQDLQIFIKQTLKKYPSKNPNGPIPPHHSLNYDNKLYQNAISNLNKVSSLSHNNDIDNKHNRNQSLSSLSSFAPSFGPSSHQRKGSNSYSLSGQNDIIQELSKKQMRQQSTPNSIGSFFKQKFQKQRSYNSQRSENNHHHHHHHRDDSNTISSFHDSEVYPPPISPTTIKVSDIADIDPEIPPFIEINHHSSSARMDILDISMKKKKFKRPESPLPIPPNKINKQQHQGADFHIEIDQKMEVYHKHQHLQYIESNRTMKKKKILKKPKKLRRSQLNKQKSVDSNKEMKKMKMKIAIKNNDQFQKKSVSQPNLMIKTTKQIMTTNQNTSSYIAVQTTISATTPKQKIKINVQPQQIIVIKKQKHNKHNNKHKIINNDTMSDDDGCSTPELSATSSNHDIIAYNKPDTPLPKHHKKQKISSPHHVNKYIHHKSRESADLEFAANQLAQNNNNKSHFNEDSEDDQELDPLD